MRSRSGKGRVRSRVQKGSLTRIQKGSNARDQKGSRKARMSMKKKRSPEEIEAAEIISGFMIPDLADIVSQYRGTMKVEEQPFEFLEVKDDHVIWKGIVDEKGRRHGIWEGKGTDLTVTVNYLHGRSVSEYDRPAYIINGPDQTVLVWIDKNGEPHRDGDKPAIVARDKKENLVYIQYFKHGVQHRERGPSFYEIHKNGTRQREWHVNGILHRNDGPAKILHRENGQPIAEVWYVNGEIHRNDGPAIILYSENGKPSQETWYIYDFPLKQRIYDTDGNFVEELVELDEEDE